MKNFYMLVLPAIFLCQSAAAQQFRFGAKAGINYTSLLPKLQGTERRFGANGGVYVRRQLSSNKVWNLQAELLYSAKGAGLGQFEYMGSVHEDKIRLHYLDFPIVIRTHAGGFFLEAGPQLSTVLGGRIELINPYIDTRFRRDSYPVIQLGYAAGLGYEMANGLSLTLRYSNDLTTVWRRKLGSDDRNSVFQAQLGYLFGKAQ